MKYITLPLIVLLISCSSAKKSVEQMNETNIHQSETLREQVVERVVDTTKTYNGKITITEIEFYQPTISEEPQGKADVNLPNVGNIKNAPIKSIKQTTIENSSEQKGESRESSESKGIQNEFVATNNGQVSQTQTSPAPNPNKWQYIFYIMIVGILTLLYIKRQPIVNLIKKLLSIIRILL